MATCQQVPSDLDKDIWWQLSSRTMHCDIFCHNFVLFGTSFCNMLVVLVFSLSSRYGYETLRDIRMRAKFNKDCTFSLVRVFKFCDMQRWSKQWLHTLWCWNVKHSIKWNIFSACWLKYNMLVWPDFKSIMSRTGGLLVSLLDGTQCQFVVCSICIRGEKGRSNIVWPSCSAYFVFQHFSYPFWYLVIQSKRGNGNFSEYWVNYSKST